MNDIVAFLVQQFYANDFLQAAVLGAPVAALSYSARAFPAKVWAFIRRCISMDIQFNSDMTDYLSIQQLISQEIVNDKLSRRYIYAAEENYDWETGEDSTKHIGLTAGYGTHWGFYKHGLGLFGRSFVWVDRSLLESGGNATEKFKEKINLTFLTRRKAIIDKFTKMIEEKAGRLTDVPTVQLYINSGSWWRKGTKLPVRSISTVFTMDNQGQALVEAIRKFDANREWCLARGLPHRMGALLDGPAGTGKSSLLHAVASETGRSIFYLNLGSVKDDKELTDLVSGSRNWRKAILVIEDFDATGAQVSRAPVSVSDAVGEDGEPTTGNGTPAEPRKPLTLSALLNVLDGVISPDGLVVIATTNHPEKLDEALIRPGRFDFRLHLGPLGWEQFVGMARLFDYDPDTRPALKDLFRPTTGSNLRALLLDGGLAAVENHFKAAA